MPPSESHCLLHDACETNQALLGPVVACYSDFGVSWQEGLTIVLLVLTDSFTTRAASDHIV